MKMMIESCGVGSCPKVRFDFDHVHLSEPIAEACSEVKTRRFFEWSKLIPFDFDSIDRFDRIVLVFVSSIEYHLATVHLVSS